MLIGANNEQSRIVGSTVRFFTHGFGAGSGFGCLHFVQDPFFLHLVQLPLSRIVPFFMQLLQLPLSRIVPFFIQLLQLPPGKIAPLSCTFS